MKFTDCRVRFAEYVATTVHLSVRFQEAGQILPDTMTVGDEFDLRVVTSNHPGGAPDPVPSDDPPDGSNLQDVRLHLQASDADLMRLLVDTSLEIFGSTGLPVVSGHNALWACRRPPATAATEITVGYTFSQLRRWFTSCRQDGLVRAPYNIDNQATGTPIATCGPPHVGWQLLWPQLRHNN